MGLFEYMSNIPGIVPRRHGNNGRNGPEWACACPFPGCQGGGKSRYPDRFVFWPEAASGNGKFFCRGCRRSGDGISLIMELEDAGFVQACNALGVPVHAKYLRKMEEASNMSPEEKRHSRAAAYAARCTGLAARSIDDGPGKAGAPVSEGRDVILPNGLRLPESYVTPQKTWQERAANLVKECAPRLAGQPGVLKWLSARGITPAAAESASLGWNPEDIYRPLSAWGLPDEYKPNGKPRMFWVPRGLVIPVFDPLTGKPLRVKIRRTAADVRKGGPKYYALRASSAMPLCTDLTAPAQVIVEAELDAICMGSLLPGICGAIGIGSLAILPDLSLHSILQQAMDVILCLDAEDTPEMERAVKNWKSLYPQLVNAPVPQGKDPGEAAEAGVDLQKHLTAQLCPALRIRIDRERRAGCSSPETAALENDGGAGSVSGLEGGQGSDPQKSKKVPESCMKMVDLLGSLGLRLAVSAEGMTLRGDTRGFDQEAWDRFSRLSDLIFSDPVNAGLLSGLRPGVYKSMQLRAELERRVG